jgi:hypothetical protein
MSQFGENYLTCIASETKRDTQDRLTVRRVTESDIIEPAAMPRPAREDILPWRMDYASNST